VTCLSAAHTKQTHLFKFTQEKINSCQYPFPFAYGTMAAGHCQPVSHQQ
jgi:hypothetical protein